MRWSIRFTFLFIIVCAQSYLVPSSSIWSKTSMAESFMKSFTTALGQENVLNDDQMDDIASIRNTLMAAVEKSSGKKNKLKALNMAFASSVAEIAFADMTGMPADVKTEAILNALREAFLRTTGFVDNYSIQEIGALINMFAEATAKVVATREASASARAATSTGCYGRQGGYGCRAGSAGAGAGSSGSYGGAAGAGAAADAGAGGAGVGGCRSGAGAGASSAGTGRYRRGAGAAAAASAAAEAGAEPELEMDPELELDPGLELELEKQYYPYQISVLARDCDSCRPDTGCRVTSPVFETSATVLRSQTGPHSEFETLFGL
ncbi:mijor ampullate spidroin 1A variant 2 [Trichonephila clavata]|uniref:Mijor ampullate spidroin 1A variant 2 n=1 Tax=Trichonephila clavata TaxID=2740835 RepID=A0A8X6GX53_TRICU|nr:mijor ampullate spidroin 1A variant 2 [Trichonephila clavata]